MSQTARKPRGKAAASKAAAARAEIKDQPESKSFTWRALDLVLPDRMPATMAFDYAELQDGTEDVLGGMFRLLKGLVGPEQFRAIRDQIAQDGDALDDLLEIIDGLLDGILGAFGMSSGDSEASSGS